MIKITDLYKRYNNVKVLKGVNLTVEKGETIALMGRSGSGKSTLLNIIGLMDSYDIGEYIFQDVKISNLNEWEMSSLRLRKIGFVFQSFNLLTNLSIYENIRIPQLLANNYNDSDVYKYLSLFGINHIKDKNPSQASGGEQQRAAIARALINNPDIIIADEPTGSLDSETSDQIINILLQINSQFNKTMIIATHDEQIAKKCNRIVRIKDGVIVE